MWYTAVGCMYLISTQTASEQTVVLHSHNLFNYFTQSIIISAAWQLHESDIEKNVRHSRPPKLRNCNEYGAIRPDGATALGNAEWQETQLNRTCLWWGWYSVTVSHCAWRHPWLFQNTNWNAFLSITLQQVLIFNPIRFLIPMLLIPFCLHVTALPLDFL